MSKLISAVIVLLLLPAAATQAADEHHSAQAGASTQDTEKSMQSIQQDMLEMHEQMHKIMDAKDPAERQKLMQQYRKTSQQLMQDQMTHMQDGMGTKMDPGMGGDEKHGAAKPPAAK